LPAVALVTDGFPTECDPQDPASLAQIAANAYQGSPRVLTYVVGLQTGEALDNLGQIAQAGGTGQAYIIKGGSISQDFVSAMRRATSAAMPCEIKIPPSATPTRANELFLEYTPAATAVQEHIPGLDDAGQCASATDGWYYDAPPPAATKVIVCPQTCQRLSAGTLELMIDCVRIP
jgi:hypothetical protein